MKFRNYVEAPYYDATMPRPWLFLAGGISGVADWQQEAKAVLHDPNAPSGTLWNPRRSNFDLQDTSVARAQIAWEHYMLAASDAVLFWFQHETVQPIALFELGRWSTRGSEQKGIFVGSHPNYQRRFDIIVQLELECPQVPLYDSLETLLAAVLGFPEDLLNAS